MLLEEFDVDKYERTLRMEGMEIGRQQGIEQGIEQGVDRANRLTRILLEQNRLEDLSHSLEDSEYQEKLFREFGI